MRLIDADYAKELGAECIAVRSEKTGELVAITAIDNLPTITAEPKHGRWMKMLCKNCPYFHIRLEYKNEYEWGLAECTKHNLVTDFRSKKKFDTLSCVDSERRSDEAGL